MNKEEAKSMVIFWIILVVVIFGAFALSSNPNDQTADPGCSYIGNC